MNDDGGRRKKGGVVVVIKKNTINRLLSFFLPMSASCFIKLVRTLHYSNQDAKNYRPSSQNTHPTKLQRYTLRP